jgi:hypothetical protein
VCLRERTSVCAYERISRIPGFCFRTGLTVTYRRTGPGDMELDPDEKLQSWMRLQNSCCDPATQSRSHLQVCGREIQDIAFELNSFDPNLKYCTGIDVQSPCTCINGLAIACMERHRIGQNRGFFINGRDIYDDPGYADIFHDPDHPVDSALRLNDVDRDMFVSGLWRPNLQRHLRKMTMKPLRQYIIDKYTGSKRKHYLKCVAELRNYGFTHGVYYPAFVKWFERQPAEVQLRYRAIVPMVSRAYGVEGEVNAREELFIGIAAGLQPNNLVECALHKLKNKNGSSKFASGHDQFRRAREIKKNLTAGYFCISVDAKAFDGSQNIVGSLVRKFIIKLFTLCFPNWINSPEGRWFVRAEMEQMKLLIRTKSPRLYGIIFGNRGSGTSGTADQNKAIMMGLIEGYFAIELETDLVRYYCDGDDTMFFFHETLSKEKIDGFFAFARRLGVEIEIENVASELEDVVFCRAKIVVVDGRPRLVKKPFDAFVTMCGIGRHFKAGRSRDGPILQDYFKTLNVGYSIMWQGVPVMSCMGGIFGDAGFLNEGLLTGVTGLEHTMREHLQHDADYQRIMWGADSNRKRHTYDIIRQPITYASRLSFERTFGIPIDHQVVLEQRLLAIGKNMPSLVEHFVSQRSLEVLFSI